MAPATSVSARLPSGRGRHCRPPNPRICLHIRQPTALHGLLHPSQVASTRSQPHHGCLDLRPRDGGTRSEHVLRGVAGEEDRAAPQHPDRERTAESRRRAVLPDHQGLLLAPAFDLRFPVRAGDGDCLRGAARQLDALDASLEGSDGRVRSGRVWARCADI